VLALQTSGTHTVTLVETTSSVLPQPSTTVISITGPSPAQLTIGTTTITANSASAYVIGTQTLFPGGSVVAVSGTTLSLATSATALVVNGHTSTLIYLAPSDLSALPPLIHDSSTLTANAASAYVIGTQTLSPGGPAITVSGTPLSLAPEGTALVVGTSTAAAGTGLGNYIWSGLGGSGTASGTVTGAVVFTGAADTKILPGRGKVAAGIGLAGVLGAVGMV